MGSKVIGVMLVLAAGFVAFAASIGFDKLSLNTRIKRATIRLHDKEGRFFCSGTLVDSRTVITAAHCILRSTSFFAPQTPTDEVIEVRDSTNKVISIGYVLDYNGRGDVARLRILQVDAANNMLDYETDTTAIINSFASDKLLLCGYPWGGKLFCIEATKASYAGITFQVIAKAWPGMSGGPLVDLNTGKVIANLQGYEENGKIVVNPFIELDNMLH